MKREPYQGYYITSAMTNLESSGTGLVETGSSRRQLFQIVHTQKARDDMAVLGSGL